MKIYRDGKQVKDATVIYNQFGGVETVRIKGVHYSSNAFEFKEEEQEVKTEKKPVVKTKQEDSQEELDRKTHKKSK